MLARLQQHSTSATVAALRKHTHILFVLPQTKQLQGAWTGREALEPLLARRRMKAGDLGKTPVTGTLKNGALAAWVMVDPSKSLFESQSTVREALQTLFAESPQAIAIVVVGDISQRHYAAETALYCAWVNGAALPERKKKPERKPLKTIDLYGYRDAAEFSTLHARAAGNVLCRELTVLPPNELTPATYRDRLRKLAKEHGWRHEEYRF